MSDEAQTARIMALASRLGAPLTEGLEEFLRELRAGLAKGGLWREAQRSDDAIEAMLRVLLGEPPAWVDEMAAEWEQDATLRSDLRAAKAQLDCAAQLRARLKP
jgi:hypothetical protein